MHEWDSMIVEYTTSFVFWYDSTRWQDGQHLESNAAIRFNDNSARQPEGSHFHTYKEWAMYFLLCGGSCHAEHLSVTHTKNSSTVRTSTVFLQWMNSFDVSGLCSDFMFARFSFQSVQMSEKNCPRYRQPYWVFCGFPSPRTQNYWPCSKTSKNRSHCKTTVILYKISRLLYSPYSGACAIGPSVTTSLTDFSFQNLFFWSLCEFSSAKIT
jgi:hypothetical protein